MHEAALARSFQSVNCAALLLANPDLMGNQSLRRLVEFSRLSSVVGVNGDCCLT